MSKKILIISSTPRKNGNSEILAYEFMRGAKDANHSVEAVSLRERNVNCCLGCLACSVTGRCVQKDGYGRAA